MYMHFQICMDYMLAYNLLAFKTTAQCNNLADSNKMWILSEAV